MKTALPGIWGFFACYWRGYLKPPFSSARRSRHIEMSFQKNLFLSFYQAGGEEPPAAGDVSSDDPQARRLLALVLTMKKYHICAHKCSISNKLASSMNGSHVRHPLGNKCWKPVEKTFYSIQLLLLCEMIGLKASDWWEGAAHLCCYSFTV